MTTMNNEVKKRLKWVKLYESIGKAGVVCLRCGISQHLENGLRGN